MKLSTPYTSSSAADPRATRATASVRQIVEKLERLITVTARSAGWSESDAQAMVRQACTAYFAGLSRGQSPDQALKQALVSAERARCIEFIGQAGHDTQSRLSALSILLERQLNPKVPLENEIIQASLQAFAGALRGGKTLDAAFDQARTASRMRARAVAA